MAGGVDGPTGAALRLRRPRTVRTTESTASANRQMPAMRPKALTPAVGVFSSRIVTMAAPMLTHTSGHSMPQTCASRRHAATFEAASPACPSTEFGRTISIQAAADKTGPGRILRALTVATRGRHIRNTKAIPHKRGWVVRGLTLRELNFGNFRASQDAAVSLDSS